MGEKKIKNWLLLNEKHWLTEEVYFGGNVFKNPATQLYLFVCFIGRAVCILLLCYPSENKKKTRETADYT